jgi:hypothetical protein
VTTISLLKCDRRQSHICFRLIGYDTKHLEYLTFHFFFIEIENFRDEGKMLMRHTHDTTFSEKILDFYKILEESEQFSCV